MDAVLTPALILFSLVALIGLFSWRSNGKRLAVVGAFNASFAGSMLVGTGILQYGLWIVTAILVFLSLSMVDRAVWRKNYLVLSLAAATLVAIAISYTLADDARLLLRLRSSVWLLWVPCFSFL